MTTHERFFHPAKPLRASAHLHSLLDSDLAIRKVRPGCGSVARNRARRYLAKRRLPKAFWPIIAIVLFIALVFDRRIGFRLPDLAGQNEKPIKMPLAAHTETDENPPVLPSETGAALNGAPAPCYTPPADFQTKHSAQMIAFLVRNRGKLDTKVVRRKWEHLDRVSIPLAVYLRDIEANDEWAALEREIAARPAAPRIGARQSDAPSSIRHQKILKLIPEWTRRGETLLTTSGSGASGPPGTEIDYSDDNTPPVPTW
jgi:hypothetical protein